MHKELSELVFSVIKPIYTKENSKRISLGTGTLFLISRQRFLITAAHVLDEMESRTLYMQDLPLTNGYWKGNGVDFAAYELAKNDTGKIASYGFISEEAVSKAHLTTGLPCQLIGYPTSKNKNFNNSAPSISPEIHAVNTSTCPTDPSEGTDYFTVKYAKNLFSPKGMSGGLVVNYGTADSPRLTVLGLPIEHDKRNQNIKCVRFSTIIQSLQLKFPPP